MPRPDGVPPGALDTGFGGTGHTTIAFTGAFTVAVAGAIQADCRSLIGGYAQELTFVARFLEDGTLDTTFGDAGIVYLHWSETLNFSLERLEVLPDGSILAAGIAGTASRRLAFAHLGPDGALDPSAPYGGVAVVVDGGTFSDRVSIGRDSSGRLILGGSRFTGSGFEYAIIRVGLDAVLDSSFGAAGEVVMPPELNARDLLVLPDDRIVVGGEYWSPSPDGSGVGAVQLLADGSFDPSFGIAGLAYGLVGGGTYKEIYEIELGTGGRLLLGGWTTNDPQRFLVAGLTETGAPEFASTRLTEVGPRTAGRAGADRPAGVGRPH